MMTVNFDEPQRDMVEEIRNIVYPLPSVINEAQGREGQPWCSESEADTCLAERVRDCHRAHYTVKVSGWKVK